MSEDVSKRLEQSMHGTPKTNPDERRHYLGSLRERVAVELSVNDMQSKSMMQILLKHFADFSEYTFLINGKVDQLPEVSQLIQKCTAANTEFSLISDETAQTDPDAVGILAVSTTAINRQQVTLPELYPDDYAALTANQPEKKKKSFWNNLFNN